METIEIIFYCNKKDSMEGKRIPYGLAPSENAARNTLCHLCGFGQEQSMEIKIKEKMLFLNRGSRYPVMEWSFFIKAERDTLLHIIDNIYNLKCFDRAGVILEVGGTSFLD